MSVYVDDDFARFGNKSYAINKINSVEVRERQPHGRGGAILCAILAVLCAMSFFGSLSAPDGPVTFMLVGAAVFGFLAYRGFQKAKIREYRLFVMTSSSEAQAFVTRDEGEVYSLRDEIESAMARHSRGGGR